MQTHTELNPRVKSSVRTQQVECRLAIVTLSRSVDFRLGQYNERRTFVIPLQLYLVPFEKVLLGNWTVELWYIIYFDSSRLALQDSSALTSRKSYFRSHTFRSGTKTAMEWFLPGETAESETPSTRNLFQTVPRSWLS